MCVQILNLKFFIGTHEEKLVMPLIFIYLIEVRKYNLFIVMENQLGVEAVIPFLNSRSFGIGSVTGIRWIEEKSHKQ